MKSRSELQILYRTIGRQLAQRRKGRGMTQVAFAEAVRLSRAAISNIESGRQQLYVHQLVEFAAVLELNPVDLVPDLLPTKDPLAKASPQMKKWFREVVERRDR